MKNRIISLRVDRKESIEIKEELKERLALYCLNLVELDFVTSWLMVVVMSSALTLTAPPVLVRLRLKIDCKKVTKREAENIAENLIKSKRTIEICNKDNSPVSIQVGEVILAANIFAIKKSLAKLSKEEQGILTRWVKVFSNKSSLGLSFREPSKGFSSDFLRNSPNFDQGAIGTLLCLCNKCEDFSQELNKAIVLLLIMIVEYA